MKFFQNKSEVKSHSGEEFDGRNGNSNNTLVITITVSVSVVMTGSILGVILVKKKFPM